MLEPSVVKWLMHSTRRREDMILLVCDAVEALALTLQRTDRFMSAHSGIPFVLYCCPLPHKL